MKKAICSILFLIFSIGTASAETDGAKKLKIGVIGPATGEGAEYSKSFFEGVKMALVEFNDGGGFKGERIQASVYDTKGSPSQTMAAVNALIKEGVMAIIASPDAAATLAPVSMANESKTVFISVGSPRHVGKSGPYIFRNSLPDETGTEEIIKYCTKKLRYKRYVIVTSMVDDEASLSVAGLFRRALQRFGGEVVADALINYGLGFKETVTQMKVEVKGTIDAVIFAGGAGDAAEFVKELRQQGINAPLISSEVLYSSEFLKSGGEAAIGSLLYASFTPLIGEPASRKFVGMYKKTTGEEPPPLAALSYDTFMMVADALKKAGTTEPAKLRDILAETKGFKGVSGAISMDKEGEAVKTPFLLRVEKGARGPEFRLVK
jgi:branched-chain amino acid transport system substrate-binding protein